MTDWLSMNNAFERFWKEKRTAGDVYFCGILGIFKYENFLYFQENFNDNFLLDTLELLKIKQSSKNRILRCFLPFFNWRIFDF